MTDNRLRLAGSGQGYSVVMTVVVALIVLALIVGIGGIIQGLFWLMSVGFILLLVGIALAISRTRSTR